MADRISGRVLVEAIVTSDGTVASATVVRSLDPGLDRNALEAAREWRFRPATLDGQPVSVSIVLELAYQLH
jgi:protein TonB